MSRRCETRRWRVGSIAARACGPDIDGRRKCAPGIECSSAASTERVARSRPFGSRRHADCFAREGSHAVGAGSWLNLARTSHLKPVVHIAATAASGLDARLVPAAGTNKPATGPSRDHGDGKVPGSPHAVLTPMDPHREQPRAVQPVRRRPHQLDNAMLADDVSGEWRRPEPGSDARRRSRRRRLARSAGSSPTPSPIAGRRACQPRPEKSPSRRAPAWVLLWSSPTTKGTPVQVVG